MNSGKRIIFILAAVFGMALSAFLPVSVWATADSTYTANDSDGDSGFCNQSDENVLILIFLREYQAQNNDPVTAITLTYEGESEGDLGTNVYLRTSVGGLLATDSNGTPYEFGGEWYEDEYRVYADIAADATVGQHVDFSIAIGAITDAGDGNAVTEVVDIDSVTIVAAPNVAPSTTTLIFPPDGAYNVPVSSSFNGYATDDNGDWVQYKIEISTISKDDFSTKTTYDQNASYQYWASTAFPSGEIFIATHTVASSLDFNTTYYWRVSAKDYAGSDTWTQSADTFTFHTRGIQFYALRSAAAGNEASWDEEKIVGEDSEGWGHMQLVPLESEKVMAIYNDLEGTTYNLRYSTGNSTSWGGEQTIVNNCKDATTLFEGTTYHYFSAVTDPANGVHLIYIDSADNDINYSSYTTAGGWTGAVEIQAGTLSYPNLSYDAKFDRLFAFWIDGNSINYKKFEDGAWDASSTTLKSGLDTPGYMGSASSDTISLGIIWREGSESPYTVSYATVSLLPGPPGGLQIDCVYTSSITASWGLVYGATGYTLAVSTKSANPPVEIWSSSTTVGINVTTATVYESSVLDPNTTYYLFVRTNYDGGSSGYAAYSATSTLANKPAEAATNFTAVYKSSITTRWLQNGNPANVTLYTAESSSSNFNGGTVYSSATYNLSATVDNLFPNTTYFFKVKATNHNDIDTDYLLLSSTSTLANTVTGARIYGVFESSVTLNWTAMSSTSCVGYIVDASSTNFGAESGGGTTHSSSTFNAGCSTLTVVNLSLETTYWFRVGAYNWNYAANYVSAGSTKTTTGVADNIAPAAISDLTALEGSNGGEVKLKWTAPGDDGMTDPIVGGAYEIKYSSVAIITESHFETPPASYTVTTIDISTDTTPGEEHGWIVTGLLEGTSYWFAMKTADEADNWAVWNSSQDVSTVNTLAYHCPKDSAPAAITNLSALTGESGGEVDLTWSVPGDDGWTGAITGGKYRIRYSTIASVDWTTASSGWTDFDDKYELELDTDTSVSGEVHGRTMTSLHEGVTYYFRIKTGDEKPNWSELSNNATAWAYVTPPAPTYSISGTIQDGDSNALEGVTVVLSSGSYSNSTTDSNGDYSFTGLAAGSYVVTPSSSSQYFNPVNYSYPSLSSDQTNQDFTGTECYGNQFLISENTTSSGKMDTTSKKTAFRFTAKNSQDIAGLRVYLNADGTPPSYRYGIQGDIGGEPSGEWLNGGNAYGDILRTIDNWTTTVSLNTAASLTAGNTYYLVAYTTSTSLVDSDNCVALRKSTPQNFKHPYDGSPNKAAGVLFYDGTQWNKISNSCGIYILEGATDEGNPYAVLTVPAGAPTVYYRVSGATWTGVQFTVKDSTKTVNKLHFYMKKAGDPTGDCCYELRGPDNFSTFIESGTFVAIAAAPADYGWVSKSLSSNRTLNKDHTYWAMLKSEDSAGTFNNNLYQMGINYTGSATSLYADLSYGGEADAQYAYSQDGGTSESLSEDRDGVFRFGIVTGDVTEPSAITTIAASTATLTGGVKLEWESPGDDGWDNALDSGSEYKIQYATYNISWDKDNAQITISTSGTNPRTLVSTTTYLSRETTYYFHIWTRDEVPNWSDISYGATVWCRIRPSAVTTLSSLALDDGTGNVQLTWIAPGDDGTTGTINSGEFRIEYSSHTDASDKGGWDYSNYDIKIPTSNVNPVSGIQYIVSGLSGNVIYYFRIWTRDENTGANAPGNWSLVSNASTATVTAVLGISISPGTCEYGDLNASSAVVNGTTITVTNAGNITETYSLFSSSAIGSGKGWLIKDVQGNDEFSLLAGFNSVKPSSTTFGADHILSTTTAKCTTDKFALDKKGIDVIKDALRNVWFLIKTPNSTSTKDEKEITVTITAGSP